MQLKIMHKERLNLGEIFREDFKSPFHVTQNGGTINGNPAINNSYDGDGSGDYIRYDHFHWNQMQDFTLVIDVKRLDSVTSQAFVSGSTATTPLVRLISGSTLQFFISQSVSPIQKGVSKSIGDPLFAVMTYDYSTDAADFWIDGAAQSGGTFVSGLSSAAGVLDIAGRLGGVDSLDGEMGSVRIFNRILTDDEIEGLYNNSTFTYKNKFISYWPLHDKKGASAPFTTTDVAGGNDLTLGDGSVSTTFPTKLIDINGYSSDGGDRLKSAANLFEETGEGTLMAWVELGDKASIQGIVSYEEGVTDIGMLLLYHTSGIYYFYSGASATPASFNEINSGKELVFLAGVHDGTNTSIYVNGVKGNDSGSPTPPVVTSAMDLTAFVRGNNTSQPCSSGTKIHGIGLANFGLTQLQIQDIYEKGPKYLGNR